jgi:hypothetical protein
MKQEYLEKIAKDAFNDELEKIAIIESLVRVPLVAGARTADLARHIARKPSKELGQRAADWFDMHIARAGNKEFKSLKNIDKKFFKREKAPDLPEVQLTRWQKAKRWIKKKEQQGGDILEKTHKAFSKQPTPAQIPERHIKINLESGIKKVYEPILDPKTGERIGHKKEPYPVPGLHKFYRVASRTPFSAAPGVAGLVAETVPFIPTFGWGAAAGATIPAAAVADRGIRKVTSKLLGIRERSYPQLDKMIQAQDISKKIESKPAEYALKHPKLVATIRDARKQLYEMK